MQVQLKVNGKAHSVDVPPNTLLVQVLRESLHLTGTHVGFAIDFQLNLHGGGSPCGG